MEAADISNVGTHATGYSVFISYSRSDLNTVRPLAAELRRLGIRTWVDLEDLRPGERWKSAIEKALVSSTAMVFCVSPLTLESAWTSIELKAAIHRKIPVIPVMLQTLEIDALPPELQNRQLYDMARHPARQAVQITARDIVKALGLNITATSSDCQGANGPQILALYFGRQPDLDDLISRMTWVSAAGVDIIPWPVQWLTASQLADIEQQLEHVSHAVLAVYDRTDLAFAHLLIGSIAAWLGPRRLTIAEGTGDQYLRPAADAVCAYYLWLDQN